MWKKEITRDVDGVSGSWPMGFMLLFHLSFVSNTVFVLVSLVSRKTWWDGSAKAHGDTSV